MDEGSMNCRGRGVPRQISERFQRPRNIKAGKAAVIFSAVALILLVASCSPMYDRSLPAPPRQEIPLDGSIRGRFMDDVSLYEDGLHLVIGYGQEVYNSILLRDLLTELYGSLGITVEFRRVPSGRSMDLLEIGDIDGELSRTSNAVWKYPESIMIPEPLISFDFMAVTLPRHPPVAGLESLRNSYIAVVSNSQIVLERTMGFHREVFDASKSALKMVEAGRVDAAIGERRNIIYLKEKNNWDDLELHGEPLFSADFYHVLYRGYDYLVPLLTERLRQMKADGTYRRIMEESDTRLREEPG